MLSAGVTAAFLLFSALCAGAAFDFKDASWEGSSELLALARDAVGRDKVRVVATIPWDELQPVDGLLVLHPEQELDYREVAAFLSAGGRLALLDDYGKGDALLDRFRIHRVRGPLSPLESLRDNPNLPIAVPAAEPSGPPHPMLSGIERVVTNHPTGLATEKGLHLTTLLELRSSSEPPTPFALIGVIGDARRCGLVSDTASDLPVGTKASGRCGRLLAMGDASAVMNLMLRYPGNRAFAGRLVEYLLGDDSWGRRGGTLYLVANTFSERGSYGNRRGLSAAVEDRAEALSRWVDAVRREGLPPALAWGFALIAGLATGLWSILSATRRYRRTQPRYARATPPVAQGGLAGRAALLAAATTHPALAVLELKSALEETLRDRLNVPATASRQDIMKEIDRQEALGRRNSKVLEGLLEQMSRAESAVTRTEPLRISEVAIRRMHQEMAAILAEIDERARKHS